MASNNLSIRSTNSKLRLSKGHNRHKDSAILKTDSNINAYSQHYEHIWTNKCPGGRKCKNYETIIQLEFQVKRLTKTIEQLNKINNYFSFNVSQKEFMYKQMLKENEKIQNDMYTQYLTNSFNNRLKKNIIIDNQKQSNTIQTTKSFNFNNIYDDLFDYDDEYSESENHEDEEKELLKSKLEKKPLRTFKRLQTMNVRHRKAEIEVDNNNKMESTKIMPSINLNFGSRKQVKGKTKKVQIKISSDKFDIIGNIDEEDEIRREREKREKEEEERRKKEEEKKKKEDEKMRKKHFLKNPYAEIVALSQRTQKHNLQNSTGISFLALTDEALLEMIKNQNINQLYKITLDDGIFLNEFHLSDKDTMNRYCDIIGTLVKDFICSITLIHRIKSFLQATVALVGCVEQGDSNNTLIKNTCKILNCERASLFIHDRITDMLVVHSAEGLKRNEIKVPKNKGIVGYVFMNGEKLKIDNAYQDERFNKEVDKKTGFKTRNIMCYPLIDNDGDIFGAIQAINKIGGKDATFDNNDEELLSIFSRQASAILKNEINKTEYYVQINRLKSINSYSVRIHDYCNIKNFVEDTEKTISGMFELSDSHILFNLDGFLYEYSSNKFYGYTNLGIAYYVFNKKICHGCIKATSCQYYNVLVDMSANDSMVTYPILDLNNNVLCILQVACNIPISEVTEKPKENEMIIFKMFDETISNWILNHQDEIEKLKEKNKLLIKQYSIRANRLNNND